MLPTHGILAHQRQIRRAPRLHSSSDTSERYGLRAIVIHRDCANRVGKYIYAGFSAQLP
jgi:hypothetical protein